MPEKLIRIPDKIKLPDRVSKAFFEFIQQMANRIAVGHVRYGEPRKEKKYWSRARMESKEYTRKGNTEQLRNIANYCFLETFAPEHKNFHDDRNVDSVTRKKFEK